MTQKGRVFLPKECCLSLAEQSLAALSEEGFGCLPRTACTFAVRRGFPAALGWEAAPRELGGSPFLGESGTEGAVPPAPGAQPALSSLSLSSCRMETFPAVAEEVLREFQVLLQHSPPPIGSTRMLQLVAINMFAVYNSQPKGTTCCSQGAGAGERLRGVELLPEEGWGEFCIFWGVGADA